MNQSQFVDEVYKVASAYNPDIDDSTSFQDVLKQLTSMKDESLRWGIMVNSFKPEPELPNFDNSPERFKQLAHDRMAQRQGQL